MRKMGMVSTCLMIAFLIVPAHAAVTVDYDTDADFSTYKTYAWKTGTAAKSSLMDKRIRKSVEEELAAVGLTLTEGEPDLYLIYHVALDTSRRVNVSDFGYMGRWRHSVGTVDVDIYDVKVGTLIIDLLDANTNEGVWRGMTQNDLPSNPTPEKIEKKLHKVLAKMLRKYPTN